MVEPYIMYILQLMQCQVNLEAGGNGVKGGGGGGGSYNTGGKGGDGYIKISIIRYISKLEIYNLLLYSFYS